MFYLYFLSIILNAHYPKHKFMLYHNLKNPLIILINFLVNHLMEFTYDKYFFTSYISRQASNNLFNLITFLNSNLCS